MTNSLSWLVHLRGRGVSPVASGGVLASPTSARIA